VLQEFVARFCQRDQARSEAEVQSDIRQFILAAPFHLDEGDVEIAALETQAGGGRRMTLRSVPPSSR
jgi:hypothetical protein